MHFLGIDIGSVYTNVVVLGAGEGLIHSVQGRNEGGESAFVDNVLADLLSDYADEPFRVGITGVLRDEPDREGVVRVSGILAVAWGVQHLQPSVRTVIELGGQTAKFVIVETGEDRPVLRDFGTNDACAAGTGAFLEQQAKRLGLSIEEFSRLSADATRAATLAGRCAVFAKSDMIHLQQKGTPPEEIAYGFCRAICRNALATLLKGREVEPPVVIAGGCARNAGIVRAFREVLDLEGGESLRASPRPGWESALGAALNARAEPDGALTLTELREALAGSDGVARRTRRFPPLAPVDVKPVAEPTVAVNTVSRPCPRPARWERREEPTGTYAERQEGFVGIDLGSVSTDFVVLDPSGELLSAVYLPTRGQPVEVLREGLVALKERFVGGLEVRGCGVTGSGRHLAAKLVGGDVVKNEITCQLLGTRCYCGDVDTVLEIGGQDSKFISVRNGQLADFVMNKICAAGTGSFLEEQAQQLGLDIYHDFCPQAFAAHSACDLGGQCTVFMETEVVNAARSGSPISDICAGLAYSIVHNYLDKVVAGRPIGRRVVFQGGVASNDAVVAAFEQVLKRPVEVHPYNRISGALGAALAARQTMTEVATASCFKGLDPGPAPTLRSFQCKLCSNYCEVNVIEHEGKRVYFGDTCERYTSRAGEAARRPVLPNLSEEYWTRCETYFADVDLDRPTVGIPRASTLVGYLPFWATFFRELGFRPLLSRDSSTDTLTTGLKHLPVGACLPIKLTAGHLNALLEQDVDTVFLPAIVLLPGDIPGQSYACPYTMAVPFMVRATPVERLLSPVISFASEQEFVQGFETARIRLGVSRGAVRTAYQTAQAAQGAFDEAFTAWAGEQVRKGGQRFTFALLGRPYNIFDAFVNLSLFERLRRMGVLAVPARYLALEIADIESNLPWRFSVDIHRAAVAVARREDLVPVLLTNFGCGPDAFTLKLVEEALRDVPHLVLELDEHRAEAGLLTRLEAFVDQLEATRRSPPVKAAQATAASYRAIPPQGAQIRVPYFADHVFAFTGAWKYEGYDIEVLPLPGPEIRALGEKYVLGKECHPYAMIVGDLIRLAQTSNGQELVYYVPGTSLPCLLHQYGEGMELLLRELGIDNLTVSCPTGAEMLETFGVELAERFYLGLLAIELLVKATCEIRPYEVNKGETDAVHRDNLRRIEAAVAGGDPYEALDQALERLARIPTDGGRKRPVVGVAGDVYTKANPAANHDLFKWLEAQGLEVWPSPFQIDLLDFGISREFLTSMVRGRFPDLLVNGSVMVKRALDTWRVRKLAASRVSRLDEPSYLEMKKLAAPYMPNEAHELLFLNVAKIVDFARGGADGIINAVCFNCMVGTASTAIMEKIRADYEEIPLITAVYSGTEDPSRHMVLEAFVSQVKDYHQRRAQSERRRLPRLLGKR